MLLTLPKLPFPIARKISKWSKFTVKQTKKYCKLIIRIRLTIFYLKQKLINYYFRF